MVVYILAGAHCVYCPATFHQLSHEAHASSPYGTGKTFSSNYDHVIIKYFVVYLARWSLGTPGPNGWTRRENITTKKYLCLRWGMCNTRCVRGSAPHEWSTECHVTFMHVGEWELYLHEPKHCSLPDTSDGSEGENMYCTLALCWCP